jgi:hypothetical protein
MAKGMREMTTWWMPLGLAILFFSVGCDRIEQRVVSPDGQTTAEVITSPAPATDAETTYVKVSAQSSSGRHLVFGGCNYGATITVAWTDAKHLTIRCENCEKLQKRVTDEDRWHDIMIHYELR